MGNGFFKYVQQLELFGFFSGYSLLFVLILFWAGDKHVESNFKKRLLSVLPYSYALIGTLYIGQLTRNFFESDMAGHVLSNIYNPFLTAWALLSILFWMRAFSNKKYLSLLHNLVFFFLLVRDVIMQIFSSGYIDILKNDMKIYTMSLLLNAGSFTVLLLLSWVVSGNKKSDSY
ncbi:MAG: hypothetical protein ACTHOB_09885 [Ginsengibacter sp.]